MIKKQIIEIEIETCDICEISFDEYKIKQSKEIGDKNYGFYSIPIKILKRIYICPKCYKRRENDWEWFEKIIKLKIDIKKLIKNK